MNKIKKIVSGGQTGVDRAALDIALDAGLECGGWCPLGRRAEDGVIDRRYPLQETPSENYLQRTHWNVRDSDGTLIINQGPFSGGTLETQRHAQQLGKPVLLIDVDDADARAQFAAWHTRHAVNVLNVAGPRESKAPGVYVASRELLRDLLA